MEVLIIVKSKKARANAKDDSNGAEAMAEAEAETEADEQPQEEEEHEDEGQEPEQPEESLEDNPALEGVVNDPKEINDSARSKIAANIVKVFVEQAATLVKSGSVTLTKDDTAESRGKQVALQVEHAVYYYKCGGTGDANEPYRAQMRAILNNIKTNVNLTARLINRKLGADELAAMNPKDMATDEQKQKDAEEQIRLEKQHVLVDDPSTGPRIRKTHKGDEYVDDSGQPAESATSKPVRKQGTLDQDTDMKSPIETPKPNIMRKPSATTKGRPFGDARRKSSANFDIDKVWSGVQGSPTEAEAPKLLDTAQQGSPPPMPAGTDVDPEVDRLLKDEDNESQPYSPKEFSDPDVVWRGRVAGGSLGTFYTTAKFAAGAKPDAENLDMSWEQLIPPEIKLHGRIQPSKADEYLCGLEYSNTTELCIISLAAPADGEGKLQFDKFFNYLKQKERYGVGSQHSMPAIKDIYLLPMESGQPLPTVMKALEHNFADPVVERSFLVPIVVKWTELPHQTERAKIFHQQQAQQTTQSPSVQPPVIQAQTPMTPHDPQMAHFEAPPRQPSFVQGVNGGGGAAGPYSTPPPSLQQQPSLPQHPPAVQQPQSVAAINALQVLGPTMSLLPSVQELVAQAPGAGEQEMRIIKECVEENSEAGQSLRVLTQMLQQKYQSRKTEKEESQTAQTDSTVPATGTAATETSG